MLLYFVRTICFGYVAPRYQYFSRQVAGSHFVQTLAANNGSLFRHSGHSEGEEQHAQIEAEGWDRYGKQTKRCMLGLHEE